MDCRCSPADIVEAQSPYEFAGFFGNAWPPGLSMPNFPGPVPTEPATVPQSITAAAFTIQRAPRHRDQNWDNATQKRRSAGFSLGLGFSLAEARESGVERQESPFVDRSECGNTPEMTLRTKGISQTWLEQPTPLTSTVSIPAGFSGTTNSPVILGAGLESIPSQIVMANSILSVQLKPVKQGYLRTDGIFVEHRHESGFGRYGMTLTSVHTHLVTDIDVSSF